MLPRELEVSGTTRFSRLMKSCNGSTAEISEAMTSSMIAISIAYDFLLLGSLILIGFVSLKVRNAKSIIVHGKRNDWPACRERQTGSRNDTE